MIYPSKLIQRIIHFKHAGKLTKEDAQERRMRFAVGQIDGQIALYWFVDPEDGVIVEAKFQVFGPPLLIGAAEIASEWVMRKTYEQASRATISALEGHLFPQEGLIYLEQVMQAMKLAAMECVDIPLVTTSISYEGTGYPGFAALDDEAKKRVIEEVLDREVRPYIALDSGGVELIDLRMGKEVVIAYQGACTTCFSATGSTLDSILQVLRAHVDPSLVVIPDPSSLLFH